MIPVDGGYAADLLPALVVFGAGGGLTLASLAMLGISPATEADAGLASGLFNTSQQVGAAVGVALLSAVAASRASSMLGSRHVAAMALTAGFRLAFLAGAGLTVAALVVASLLLRQPRGRHVPADTRQVAASPDSGGRTLACETAASSIEDSEYLQLRGCTSSA